MSETKVKKVIEQTSCPNCSSSDAFTIYEEGGKLNGHCFACGFDQQAVTNRQPPVVRASTKGSPSVQRVSAEEGCKYPIKPLKSRKISQETCDYFGVRVGVSSEDGETPVFTLFPRYRKGNLVGYKTKDKDKNIVSSGGANVDPFGLHKIKPKGKKLWITEGEEDCMSVFEALKRNSSLPGWEPDVISIPDGASASLNSLSRCYDKLINFEEIILVFDNDEAGTTAREEVCKLFAGKVGYVIIPSPYKDANDMLKDGKEEQLKWLCLTGYQNYEPDGIIDPKDKLEEFLARGKTQFTPFPEFMDELSKNLYGFYSPAIYTYTGGTGTGKTQQMREIVYHLYKNTDKKIACMFLEEGWMDTTEGLLSLDLNKRIGLPNIESSDKEITNSWNSLFSSSRIYLYDYFGGLEDDNLLSKLKFFAMSGYKHIVLDHLSIVISEFADQGDERLRQESLMTKLAKFVKEFDVTLHLIVHLRKSSNTGIPFEEGCRPTLDDLKGASGLKQLSFEVFGYTRNQQHHNPYTSRVVEITCLKSRKTGRTGTKTYVIFDEDTGRYKRVPKPIDFDLRSKKQPSLEESQL